MIGNGYSKHEVTALLPIKLLLQGWPTRGFLPGFMRLPHHIEECVSYISLLQLSSIGKICLIGKYGGGGGVHVSLLVLCGPS